ncbi:sphingosine N-acyltransferase [Aureococcus anophagefferens]|nr:sphingosine N-acyltransferase [Aureococcus anophagefferens]
MLDAVKSEVLVLLTSFVTPEAEQKTKEPDVAVDAAVAAVFTVLLFALNWGLRLVVVKPFATLILGGGRSRAFRAKVTKFSQAAMECLIYGRSRFRRASAASVLLEPKRKDFVEMQLHHVVTVAVVAISYLHGWNRIGCVVMVLLDPADVPLHVAKMFKHAADAAEPRRGLARVCTFCADRVFELFAVFFLVTRISMYPRLLCYWFFLIIKVAIKMLVSGGGAEDNRSDDEDDEPPKKTEAPQHPKFTCRRGGRTVTRRRPREESAPPGA